jgi:hypothetical protein
MRTAFHATGARYASRNRPVAVQDAEAPRAADQQADARERDPDEAHRQLPGLAP